MKHNDDIREYAKKAGVKLWEIAERLNIADTTLSRHMRRELSQEQKDMCFDIIDDLKRGEQ